VPPQDSGRGREGSAPGDARGVPRDSDSESPGFSRDVHDSTPEDASGVPRDLSSVSGGGGGGSGVRGVVVDFLGENRSGAGVVVRRVLGSVDLLGGVGRFVPELVGNRDLEVVQGQVMVNPLEFVGRDRQPVVPLRLDDGRHFVLKVWTEVDWEGARFVGGEGSGAGRKVEASGYVKKFSNDKNGLDRRSHRFTFWGLWLSQPPTVTRIMARFPVRPTWLVQKVGQRKSASTTSAEM